MIEGDPVFLLENTSVEMHPGDGIFINSGALHSVKENDNLHVVLHSAVFHMRLIGSTDSFFWHRYIRPLLDNTGFRYLLLREDNGWQGEALKCFHSAWHAETVESDDYENVVRYELTKALGILTSHMPVENRPLSLQEALEAERIRKMLEFIDVHFSEDLTVQQIADCASISVSVCQKSFLKTLGTTPIQYLRSVRLNKAAELLRISDKTAKETALECGFNDVSYFSKSFREKMGMTPKNYQCKWRNSGSYMRD